MLPTESTARPYVKANEACVALPPSPSDGLPGRGCNTPFPATVVMMPVLNVTFRTRKLNVSVMNISPDMSNATFVGRSRGAAVARMLSTTFEALDSVEPVLKMPLPATTEIIPVLTVILRT